MVDEVFLFESGLAGGPSVVSSTFEDVIWDAVYSIPTPEGGAVPKSHRGAMSAPPDIRRKWRHAQLVEYRNHMRFPTFGPPLLKEHFAPGPPLRCIWVFHVKPDGTFRARIVMMGQFMVRGLHYGKTFAPTPSAIVIRVFVTITAREKRRWVEFDVRGAFLTQKLPAETPVDIILPPGFNDTEPGSPGDVSDGLRRRCFRAIPGCPNGSRLFYLSMRATLKAGGFEEVSTEYPCLCKDSFDPCLWAVVWVDNVYVNPISGVHDTRVAAFKKMLESACPQGLFLPRRIAHLRAVQSPPWTTGHGFFVP